MVKKKVERYIYPAIFKPFSDGTGGYVVEVPDLQGCVTEGRNLVEAIEMAVDAASGWILDELESGNSIPRQSELSDISVPDGSFANLIVLDMDTYQEKYGSKSVKKSITIPAWLNTFGETHNINFSKVLQNALLQEAQK